MPFDLESNAVDHESNAFDLDLDLRSSPPQYSSLYTETTMKFGQADIMAEAAVNANANAAEANTAEANIADANANAVNADQAQRWSEWVFPEVRPHEAYRPNRYNVLASIIAGALAFIGFGIGIKNMIEGHAIYEDTFVITASIYAWSCAITGLSLLIHRFVAGHPRLLPFAHVVCLLMGASISSWLALMCLKQAG